jgi:DNA-binding transcriptional regulator/RsmH inhibitor MraZ
MIETKLRALPSLREENRRLQRLLIGNAVDLELDGSGRFWCRRVCASTPSWISAQCWWAS